MDIDLRRYDEFPPVSRGDYEAAVAKALGARTLDQLRAVTLDGIRIPPLGSPRPDRDPLAGRAVGRPWTIVQKVLLADADAANAQILDELAGGADGVDLLFPAGSPPSAAASGSGADLQANLIRVFSTVHLDMIRVHLTGASDPLAVVEALGRVAQAAGRDASAVRVHGGFDPLAAALVAGGDFAAAARGFDETVRRCLAAHRGEVAGSLLASRGEVWRALGASDLQQLAISVASGCHSLRRWFAEGGDKAGAGRLAAAIEFRLVADQVQFVTTARLRAFRRLWALALDGFGLAQAPAFVHAETSWRMMTRRDPWVNILRTTIAAFAAAVGGADAITTVPHTAALGRPDAAARRLSRNVQTILMEEVNLARVSDPAAGAGGLEDLTDRLAEGAWATFQEIEREGGIAESLASGALTGRIAAMDARERDLAARRRLPITGASTYPLLSEAAAPVDPGDPLPAPAPGARRLSEPFEALRDRSDAILSSTGRRPSVFLATLGAAAAHGTRAAWARNVLAAGGIEASGGEPMASAEAAAE
ncbi:MAG TPA: methylmalonyl-CoA mutase family protein, partial [Methylomirabilota bacterium]|nr:methylmalonyl-CoA mutase family protein [Methylomirabilota bacterium]